MILLYLLSMENTDVRNSIVGNWLDECYEEEWLTLSCCLLHPAAAEDVVASLFLVMKGAKLSD